ncbi:zinc finger protein 771-like [Cheilinus undulatus]|uniref:zinc finger protein 771-like n=1 Tax=Cheilinus undulatus TaxID=241271 RepID=UPI001BD697F3|nr:zinc finger protein 771-like [Cheilinus undulatus]
MSKIEMLRLLINQRLTEAAEEIFGVFGRTIAEYEEEISRSKLEIDRQRRLLDLARKPRISLEFNSSELHGRLDWSSGLDPSKTEPPHIKGEEEVVEDNEEETVEQNNESFFIFQNSSVKNEEEEDGHVTPSTSNFPCQDLEMDPQPGPSVPQSSSDLDEDVPEASDPGQDNGQLDCFEVEQPLAEVLGSYICSVCGLVFDRRTQWAEHMQVHRKGDPKGDRSFTCAICGKRLTRFDGYQKHLRVHTGEKPYGCAQCGRRFSDNSNYKRHIRTHMGQKTQQSSG